MRYDFSDEAFQSYPFAQTARTTSWEQVALADITVDVSPGFASGKHNSHGTGIPHLRPMNVDRDGKIDLSTIKSVTENNGVELTAGDVLFNNTNSAELVGKTAVISHRENGFAFSNHMTRIRPANGVVPAFLARQLHFLWTSGYMQHRCTNHVNQASISSRTLANTVPILLPPSAEQLRIVEKLEELLSDLDAGVAELKAAQKKLGQYRQSLLKAAVEGALTADWRKQHQPKESGEQLLQRILKERRTRWEAKQLAKFAEQDKAPPKGWQDKYPEPCAPDTADLPALPDGWMWASVDCVLSEIETGKSFKCEERPPGKNEHGVVKVSAVSWGEYDEQESKTCTDPERLNPSLYIREGDFLFSRANTIELVGACVIAKQVHLKVMLSDKILRFIFVADELKNWLLHFLRSELGRSQIELLASGNQESMRNIGQERIRQIALPLPPLAEVTEILQLLEQQLHSANEQSKSISMGMKQAAAQRKNILRAAFSGQLVPQDPKDEPASVLLERIRAERAARGTSAGKGRSRKPKTAEAA